MSTFKRVKVMRLRTYQTKGTFVCEKRFPTTDPLTKDYPIGRLSIMHATEFDRPGWKQHHLYITTFEKIEIGDWYIQRDGGDGEPILRRLVSESEYVKLGGVGKANELGYYPYYYQNAELENKVIATTDPILELPSLSQEFLKKYVQSSNNGKVIEEALVEFIKMYSSCQGSPITWSPVEDDDDIMSKFFIKTDKENTITIRKLKESWNREEVEQALVYCVSEIAAGFGLTPTSADMKKFNDATHDWAKENLY